MNEITEYKIIIDNTLVDEYCLFYFKQHPRARKKPIDRPIHPSLNQWMILPRIQMNALKQKWKDFGKYVIKKHELENKRLDNFEMEFKVFMPSKRRIDADNTCPKFLLDAFTEAGFIVDDDSKHLHSLTLRCGYDKDNPRTEIIVRVLKEENKDAKKNE